MKSTSAHMLGMPLLEATPDDFSVRMLAVVSATIGKESVLYEKAGGTRISERKSPSANRFLPHNHRHRFDSVLTRPAPPTNGAGFFVRKLGSGSVPPWRLGEHVGNSSPITVLFVPQW